MGQIEVYDYLKQQRLSGNNKWFSAREIQQAFKDKGFSTGLRHGVSGDLRRLEVIGFLEGCCNGSKWNNWRRVYRIKKKYIKKTH